MPREIQSYELENLHGPFRRSMLFVIGAFGSAVLVQQLFRFRLHQIVRRVYQTYAGNVLDAYPRRVLYEIDLIAECRAQLEGKITPIKKIHIIDDPSNALAAIVDSHPKFHYNEIPLGMHAGPQLDSRGKDNGPPADAYTLPIQNESMQTVACLFGLSKTRRNHTTIMHEFSRVGVRATEGSEGCAIVLLDWARMPVFGHLQELILRHAGQDFVGFPALEQIAASNGCVPIVSKKYLFGAVSLVIAQRMT